MDQASIVLLIVEIGLLIVTGAAAVAAVVQARMAVSARDEAQTAQAASEAARDEAVILAREANAAFVRQADAQERTAAAMEAARPKPTVSWSIGEHRPNKWLVRNTGNAVARQARIWDASEGEAIFTLEDAGPRDVAPGDALAFRHLKTGGGGTAIVGLAFLDPESAVEQTAERRLH